MPHAMRAKLRLHHVDQLGHAYEPKSETLHFHAVAASRYPEDGSDENNTFARFSPSASMSLTVANPALLGKLKAGEEYYVDFTPAS